MSDKLRCEIVQDLLPSYVDELTSDETNEAIKDHLADCVSCRDMYERMKADEMSAEENSEVMEKEKKEINFLKRIKQKHRLNLVVVVVILTAFFAAPCACFSHHDSQNPVRRFLSSSAQQIPVPCF